jgi:hypothetical protein
MANPQAQQLILTPYCVFDIRAVFLGTAEYILL